MSVQARRVGQAAALAGRVRAAAWRVGFAQPGLLRLKVGGIRSAVSMRLRFAGSRGSQRKSRCTLAVGLTMSSRTGSAVVGLIHTVIRRGRRLRRSP